MPTIKLKNFKYGLDSRRSELESQPGTLVELENAHINQGGEIEKRKAFVYTAFPADTFGAQATSLGIVTFGSIADPGGWAAISTAVGETVYYQRLQHPEVLRGEAYSAGSHAMTGIVASELFGDDAWVAASFADGSVHCYYAGVHVYDFTDGLVLPNRLTTAEIAADFNAMVNRTTQYDATVAGSVVTVTGPLSNDYQVAVSDESSLGTLASLVSSLSTVSTSANPATGSFRITGGSAAAGTNKVSKVEVQSVFVRPTVTRETTANVAKLDIGTHALTVGTIIDVAGIPGYNVVGASISAVTATTISYANVHANEASTPDGSGSVRAGTPITITNAAVDWRISNAVTASDIATSINAKSSTPEYTAIAIDNLVTIQAEASQGDTPNDFEVKVTTSGNVCVGEGLFQFVGTRMTVDSFNVDGANILTATFAFPATYLTINALVAAVATNIRAGSATHGYTAFESGPLLLVSKVVVSSKDAPLDVFVTLSNTLPGSGVTFVGGGTASIPALGVTVKPRKKAPTDGSFPNNLPYGYEFEADVNGGVAPYTYIWTLTMPSDGSFAKGNLNAEVSFGRTDHFNEPIYATVVVTDSFGSVTTSSPVTVYSA